ncbi:MAG: histidine phosphatase family protein [bacterium]
MSRVFLFRHGETESNVAKIYQGQGNSKLTQKGVEQAQSLASFFKNEDFSAVYSSDLIRSYDTACIFAKPHKLKVAKIENIKERFYGDWEGMTFEEIELKYPAIYRLWLKDPNIAVIPKAETLSQLQQRGVSAIEDLAKNHVGENISVIAHGGINRAILFYYLNLDLNNFWRIRQDNAAINILDFHSEPRIRTLNATCWPIGKMENTY